MLNKIFSQKPVVIPYLTLGDPSFEVSIDLMKALAKAGASAIELGIPFSDPLADGPVIQASHQRALATNPKLSIQDGFKAVTAFKKEFSTPVLFMLAANLVIQFGLSNFFKQAAKAGISAVVIPDLPPEEASKFLKPANSYGVNIIFLVSPLCSEKRLQDTLKVANGFIYLISSTGTTGQRQAFQFDLAATVSRIKAIKPIPVVIGFGVSTAEQVTLLNQQADGVIVGSVLVKELEKHLSNTPKLLSSVKSLFKTLSGNN